MPVSRRDFLATGATAAAGVALGTPLGAAPSHGALSASVGTGAFARPVVIASDNGIRGVKTAYDMIVAGADTIDAIMAGVNITELDPEDMSVGLGGLPNEDGIVQLDASCMHGPTKRAGAVGCLEGIATPSLVAKAVMDYTDHIMLVGDDAKRFALKMGFKEQDLLTDEGILAAVQAEPDTARGLGGALATLAEQPAGPWLLGLVAAGLIAYGLFMLVQARYRDVSVR